MQGSTSGNAGLRNEIADQWSIGFVYQPSFVPGLAITFDWVDIEVTKAIFNFGLASILQVCYDSPGGNADACSRFQRGTSTTATTRQGQILTNGEPTGAGPTATGPSQGFINAGYTNFDGFTAGIDYQINLEDALGGAMAGWFGGDPGKLDISFDLFNIDTVQTSVTGLGFDLNRDEGEIGQASWQWKWDTNYTRGDLGVIWTVNYQSEAAFNNDFTRETRSPLRVNEYFIHDLSLSYDLDNVMGDMGLGLKGVRARVNVKNVFDKEAPYGTTGLGVYDPIGRYYQVGLTAKF